MISSPTPINLHLERNRTQLACFGKVVMFHQVFHAQLVAR